ncbi:hypothetical protein J2S13_002095 [Oikeobacillus pervagus]|uniref:Hydrolase n=1 Tax=Oikeobacillus pervagus TaxID=1325931 RepID=A0AAJ1T2N0_9BACI|nr:hydrolase [Oikeobacillus pervagus]MDQ0215677.1 hypothetical protein [Oikeobacillus pervagus]
MQQKIFQYDHEWCMVHYPAKPNGFAVMILGDRNHFVNESGSFWMENEGRKYWIEQLNEAGYLVFYSNLYGNHWGNTQACQLAINVFQFLKRTEIINSQVHIIAEGTGALLVKEMIDQIQHQIRSIVFISPCLSLALHNEQEKSRKFFYKKFIKELAMAFKIQEKDCEELIQEENFLLFYQTPISLYFIQCVELQAYKEQFELIQKINKERMDNRLPSKLEFIINNKKWDVVKKWESFFKKNEKYL